MTNQHLMATIVSHTSPDWDSIGATWLLLRFGGDDLAGAVPMFVHTGAPDPALLRCATAVVDTGGVYDPAQCRFDHHQDPTLPCATALVFQWLLHRGADVQHLAPLISLIHAGDTGGVEARPSMEVGIHALLQASKQTGASDHDVMAWACVLLDLLDATLRLRARARDDVRRCTVYTSADGRLIALDGGGPTTTVAAGELGYAVAVFASRDTLPDGSTTWARGIQRLTADASLHVGALVARAADAAQNDALRRELLSWYRHPAGFFAGRGTRKAPDPTPPAVDVVAIAQAIDVAWQR
jgi:hypothetical protein